MLEVSVLLVLFLPLLSFILSSIISEKYSWITSVVAPFLLLLSTAFAIYLFSKVWNNAPYSISWKWFSISSMSLTAGIYMNNIAALMTLLVTLVSFLVHLYSIGYMAGDAHTKRYFAMLGFFTFSMLGIVLADNLFVVFIFWELVGFSSYMLIGHWKEKPLAAAAAKKAFIINRMGDAGFLVGLMIIWANTQTFSLIHLAEQPPSTWQLSASLCLFCGVMGKSAQFPFLTWLPDAMEGPTPISALIHAATMVAAGVFLLARTSFLFPTAALDVIAIIGVTTALIGALSALAQTDLKKILAYSTISQLGLMVTAVGAGSTEAAILHLFTHAFFKACLFLSAGSIIHSLHQAQHEAHLNFDVQDIRNLGGLRKKIPFTFLAFLISGSALAGIPFFSGFISKEAIFSSLLQWHGDAYTWRSLIVALAFLISFLTVIYTYRLVSAIFLGQENLTKNLSVQEPPAVMRAPVTILMVCSTWLIISWNPFSSSSWVTQVKAPHSMGLTIFSILWILLAGIVSYFSFKKIKSIKSSFLLNGFYLDKFYDLAISKTSMQVALLTQRADKNWIDGFIHASAYVQVTIAHLAGWFDRALIDGSVNGVARLARYVGIFTRSFQGGKIQLYIFWAIFAIIIFLIWSLI